MTYSSDVIPAPPKHCPKCQNPDLQHQGLSGVDALVARVIGAVKPKDWG